MKIISISDLITNSSSEVFCTISGPEKELQEMEDILVDIFGYNQEYEVTPVVGRNDEGLVIDLPYNMIKNDKFMAYWNGAIQNLVKQFDNCKFNEKL